MHNQNSQINHDNFSPFLKAGQLKLKGFSEYAKRIEEIRLEVIDQPLIIYWHKSGLTTVTLMINIGATKSKYKRYYTDNIDSLKEYVNDQEYPGKVIISGELGLAKITEAASYLVRNGRKNTICLIAQNITENTLGLYDQCHIDSVVLESSVLSQNGALLHALRAMNTGSKFRDPEIIKTINAIDKVELLTPRQHEVLIQMCAGRTNEEIGSLIGCTTVTARDHVKQVIQKLGTTNRTAAVAFALRNRIVE